MTDWIDAERDRLFAEAEARDAAEMAAHAHHVRQVNAGPWKYPVRPAPRRSLSGTIATGLLMAAMIVGALVIGSIMGGM